MGDRRNQRWIVMTVTMMKANVSVNWEDVK